REPEVPIVATRNPRLRIPDLRADKCVAALQPAGIDDSLQELTRSLFARSAEDLLRRALLEDDAGLQEADTARDVAREAHLVRRDHHRHPTGRELADHVEHLGDEL